jgi:anti-sigma regulatory factor (Ser/Thr protein kinase)
MIHSSTKNNLELSSKIQRALIPKSLPRIQGIEIASLFLPCNAIGGDLYDVVLISEDMVAFYILDISSQGIPSALIASLAKVTFHECLYTLTSPEVILNRINTELIRTIPTDFFITAFVAVLDLHNNKLTYCNAGHTYPFIFRKSEKRIIQLQVSNVFLGVYKDTKFENESIYLIPEDIILLFTDGLYTLFRNEKDILGREQLETFILNGKYRSPADLIKKYKTLYKKTVRKQEQIDDITALIIEVLTQSRREKIKTDLGFDKNDPMYLQFLSYYEEIDTVLANLLRDMDNIGYSNESIRKMKLTITELLANAIGHGNKGDHSKKVTMGHLVKEPYVTVAIMDEGKGFNFHNIPDPTLPENLIKDRGRGLYIVGHYVDEIHFNKKGNRILIRKYRTARKKNDQD